MLHKRVAGLPDSPNNVCGFLILPPHTLFVVAIKSIEEGRKIPLPLLSFPVGIIKFANSETRDEIWIFDLILIIEIYRGKTSLKTLLRFQKKYVSQAIYVSYGKYSLSPYRRIFMNWEAALKEADLIVAPSDIRPQQYSDEELLESVVGVARSLDAKTVTTSDYRRYGKHSCNTLLERFKDWESILQLANLEPTGHIKQIPTEELFEEIERLWRTLGRAPTTTDIRGGLSHYSLNTFIRRFGGWRSALVEFVKFANGSDAQGGYLDQSGDGEKNTPISKKKRKSSRSKPIRRTSREPNLRLRFRVMQRDNFKCCFCGKSPAKNPDTELHVDHIRPWSKGGETILENLQVLCSDCNLGKGSL